MVRKHTFFALVIALLWPVTSAANSGDYVVLLHGIMRSSAHMKKLGHYLAARGYTVLNLDYPSTQYPIEILSQHVHLQIEALTPDPGRKIHFIGYSMGALVVRSLLNKYKPVNLGRVVLLAPPNGGSEVADFLKNNILYKFFYGPAGQQLTTDQTALIPLLDSVNYEVGVIAGDRSIDPISSLMIKGENDGKVSVNHTKLLGMKDHITLHATHTFFPGNREVLEQSYYFLEHGQFNRGIICD